MTFGVIQARFHGRILGGFIKVLWFNLALPTFMIPSKSNKRTLSRSATFSSTRLLLRHGEKTPYGGLELAPSPFHHFVNLLSGRCQAAERGLGYTLKRIYNETSEVWLAQQINYETILAVPQCEAKAPRGLYGKLAHAAGDRFVVHALACGSGTLKREQRTC